MKKILYATTAVLALIACSKVPAPINPENETNGKVITVKATIEGSETKTSYEEDLENKKAKVSWEAGDKIGVLSQNGGYVINTLETTSGNGVFTGTILGTEGGKYAHVAVYPYDICTDKWNVDKESREQIHVTLASFITGSGADAIPMAVHTPNASFDGTYNFKHMGSVIRFKFTNIPSTARKLVITSADHELAGLHYVDYDSTNGLFYYTSGTGSDGNQKTITYSFTPGADGKYTFYLPFGCTISPSGNFTFTFKDSENADICTRTTALGSLASVTLARNKMYRVNMDVISFDGYPGVSSLVITPSSLKNTENNAFTVDKIDFYAHEAFKENSTNIKIKGDSDLHGKIYNTTSLGRIIRIVIEKDECTSSYDGSYFTLYAGSSSNPSSTTISYTSYVYNDYASYTLTSGDYAFFSFENNKTWSSRIGKITIYYYKPTS